MVPFDAEQQREYRIAYKAHESARIKMEAELLNCLRAKLQQDCLDPERTGRLRSAAVEYFDTQAEASEALSVLRYVREMNGL